MEVIDGVDQCRERFPAQAASGNLPPYLPSHPHEGGVRVPENENARVIAAGHSKVTGRRFNLSVAFEAAPGKGRAIAESSFHHFADYNWDPRRGCPSFVDEPAGDTMLRDPAGLASVQTYVRNVATWLGQR